MGDWIVSFFGKIIGNKYLLCAVLSVFPITEIKGGILCAAVADVRLLLAFACCFLSSVALAAALSALCPALLRAAEKSLYLFKSYKRRKRFSPCGDACAF